MWRRKKAAQRDGRDGRRSASAERQPRQRYARDGEQVLQFRPSQVGVSSIAARRREQKIEAAWKSDISDWERKMRDLKDAVQHERALETESSGQSHGGRPVSSAAADATVSAFLAETRVRNEMAQRSAGAAAAAPAPSAPKAEPAREEAGQVVDEELMDAILLEAA